MKSNEKKYSLILILFVGYFSTSCISIRETSLHRPFQIEESNYHLLNGVYNNTPDSFDIQSCKGWTALSKENYYLWDVFSWHKGRVNHEFKKNCDVGIHFLNSKKAEVTLTYKDSLVASRMIRGKIRNGHFYKRPSFIAIPFIPLVFGYSNTRYRMTTSGDGKLIIDEAFVNWGCLFLGCVDQKAQTYGEYGQDFQDVNR